MPYNPSTGVYSLPAIYLAVPGTVIIAAQHNTPLVDLQTANNYERPIIAGGTGAGSIAGAVANLSLVQYTAQTLDDAQKAQARSNIGSATAGTFEQKSANYPVLAEDLGKTFLFTASATASFAAAADLGANFECEIWANFGVTVTLDPDASETINGASTFILQPGDKVTVWCDGTALFAKATGDPTVGPQIQGYSSGLALTTNATDATNDVDIAVGVAAADVSPYNLMQLTSALTKRLDASWAVGTNQGGLDTGAVGNNTYYIWLIQRSDTGVVDVLFSLSATAPTMPTNYDRKRLLGLLVRASATNSAPYLNAKSISNIGPILLSKGAIPGTAAVDFSVPAGVRRATLLLSAFSTDGTSAPIVQLKAGGAAETSGYVGGLFLYTTSAATGNFSVGFSLTTGGAAATVYHMVIDIILQDGNTWEARVSGGFSNAAGVIAGVGSKTLSAVLDGIRLTTVGGVNVPDAGTYALYVEY